MVNFRLAEPTESLTYYEFTERLYYFLSLAYWSYLPEFDDYLEGTKLILNDYRSFLSPKPSRDTLTSLEELASGIGIEWDSKLFMKYTSEMVADKTLSGEDTNRALLGLGNVFIWLVSDLEEALEGIRNKKYYKEGDYLFVGDMINPVLSFNESIANKMYVEHAEKLREYYSRQINSPAVNKELFKKTELREFSRLLETQSNSNDWTYLSERLGFGVDAVREIYQYRVDVIHGKYGKYLLLKDNESALDKCSLLLAVIDYIAYLKDVGIKPPEKTASRVTENTIELPRIGDLNKIDFGVSKKVTENYLLALSSQVGAGEPIMKEEDVKYWLRKDWAGFASHENEEEPEDRTIELLGNERSFAIVRTYIYWYWYTFTFGKKIAGGRDAVCKMLIRRFKPGAKFETMRSNFSVHAGLPGHLKINVRNIRPLSMKS
ncbi:MAG: hypothetical protein ACLQQ4_07300 [Bacteroidia bacterium]